MNVGSSMFVFLKFRGHKCSRISRVVPVEKNTFRGKKFSRLGQKYYISREDIFAGGQRYGFPCINKNDDLFGETCFRRKEVKKKHENEIKTVKWAAQFSTSVESRISIFSVL